MKEKHLLKKINTFELDQMLHAYNIICQIIREKDKKYYENAMYIDAIVAIVEIHHESLWRKKLK